MDAYLNKWENQLLDLGKRNKLIKYNKGIGKRTHLKIISPDFKELYHAIVVDEKTLSFPRPVTDRSDTKSDTEREEIGESSVKENYIKGDLQSEGSVTEQQKTLANLRRKAKLYVEERGINILYLIFGFLKWTERTDSEEEIYSPLVLVPVSLKVDSISSPYTLTFYDDEIVLNPTLTYKLKSDFGLELPQFDENEQDIDEFLAKVKDTAKENNWEVVEETELSLLSFLKINVLKDLKKNEERIKSNPVARALTGNPEDLKPISDDLTNFDYDKVEPEKVFQVVDADSSQQDAILYAKKGISFVLQGPPGTGKSQTITNIISESIAAGKKVLFVSEKMAALEVVYKRLAQANLSDFCLKLHNYRAKKNDVINQLKDTFQIQKYQVNDDAIYQLENLQKKRDALNEYDTELHTPVSPLNKTIFEINAELSKFQNAPELIFSVNNIENTTPELLNQYRILLTNLESLLKNKSDDFNANPWRDTTIDEVSYELRHDIPTHCNRIIEGLKDLFRIFAEIESQFQLTISPSMKHVLDLEDILDAASESPQIPASWIANEDVDLLSQEATQFQELKREYFTIKKDLLGNYTSEFLKLKISNLRKELVEGAEALKPLIKGDFYNKSVASAQDRLQQIEKLNRRLIDAKQAGKLMAELFDIRISPALKNLGSLHKLINLLLSSIHPTENWFDTNKRTAVKTLIKQANDRYKDINRLETEIGQKFDKEILKIDPSSMLSRFKTEYGSILKAFKKDYRRDKKLIRSFAKDYSSKPSDSDIVSLLTKIKTVHSDQSWLSENKSKLVEFIGKDYMETYTNWDNLNRSMKDFEMILSYFKGQAVPMKIQNFLLSERHETKTQVEHCLHLLTEQSGVEKLSADLHSVMGFKEDVEMMNLDLLKTHVSSTYELLSRFIKQLNRIMESKKNTTMISEEMKNIEKLDRFQQISAMVEQKKNILENKYCFLYHGLDTDWDHILESLIWTKKFKKLSVDFQLPEDFINNICENKDTIAQSEKYKDTLHLKLGSLSKEWNWYINLFSDKRELLDLEYPVLLDRVERCANGIHMLEDWIDFKKCKDKFREKGLSDFIKQLEAKSINKNDISGAFFKRFYRLWLDAILPGFPAVASFRGRKQDENIQEFDRLDQLQLKINRQRILAKLASKLPDLNQPTSAFDEVGILKREFNKKRRLMPLRKLFTAIPDLILTLKPCLMMSPLSVSLYLEDDHYQFDLVVFDEASQVRTEEAIGAILRGKQVVIAGDSEQLPPTNFFGSDSEEDFDSEEETVTDNDAFQSVLDQAISVLPERTLLWHYRSKDERLIAFSNAKIYHSNLITFPSNKESATETGLQFVYVPEGVFIRQKSGGKLRSNPKEARKVVELVFEHITKYPNRSLGIVSFNEAQQQVIEGMIQSALEKNKNNRKVVEFFNENKENPFFIKNLENVQGDERDTIIFSIGYAKDENKKMYMNFGPLSKDGGYRRLNVAITRAKYNVKVVSSILPDDIDLERTNSKGAKLLRAYLSYAKNGPKVLQHELHYSESVIFESPFEESVYNFLIDSGYKVKTQVGSSGYRIDLAVESPIRNGLLVLGIECDGAAYHSARTARERDRLRQTILEDIGWTIYRIWSTDWIKDPKHEEEKLLNVVNNAISQNHSVQEPNSTRERSSAGEDQIINDFITPVQVDNAEEKENPFHFETYKETNIDEICRCNDLSDAIFSVVSKESPVHIDLLCRRLASSWNSRVTKKFKENIENRIQWNLREKVEERYDFLWLLGKDTVIVRKPKDNNHIRPIQYICYDELAKAMKTIVGGSVGIDQQHLITMTAKVFGFKRVGNKISASLENVYQNLLNKEELESHDGRLTLSSRVS